MTIKIDSVITAQVAVSATDGNGYSLSANFNLDHEKEVKSLYGGIIKDSKGIQLATFSSYEKGNLNVNYETEEGLDLISNSIKAFIADAKEAVKQTTIEF